VNATETTRNERRPPLDRYSGPNPTRPTRPCTLHNRTGLINRLELLSTDRYPKRSYPGSRVCFLSVSVPTRMPTARSKHVFRYREARTGRLPGFQARSPI